MSYVNKPNINGIAREGRLDREYLSRKQRLIAQHRSPWDMSHTGRTSSATPNVQNWPRGGSGGPAPGQEPIEVGNEREGKRLVDLLRTFGLQVDSVRARRPKNGRAERRMTIIARDWEGQFVRALLRSISDPCQRYEVARALLVDPGPRALESLGRLADSPIPAFFMLIDTRRVELGLV